MRWMLVVVLVVVLVVGCAGGSPGGVEDAVGRYSAAFLEGRGGEAYGMLSDRCRDVWEEGEFAAVVVSAGELYGPQELEVRAVDVDGEVASVSYGFPDVPQLDQDAERWVFEDGRWRNDDC